MNYQQIPSRQLKQILSPVQLESLNILAMNVLELQEFLQTEAIENPLLDDDALSEAAKEPVLYRENDCSGMISHHRDREDEEEAPHELYHTGSDQDSPEELIHMQINWSELSGEEAAIVRFCVHSLDERGYLPLRPEEIGRAAGAGPKQVEAVLERLKKLEPRGIFSYDLEECLLAQLPEELRTESFVRLIRNHLPDIAGGRINVISRSLNMTSAEVRKMIQVVKKLNPLPLNGYGGGQVPYIFPDLILSRQGARWTITQNDGCSERLPLNDYYIKMIETVQDAELKAYFEDRLGRIRFISKAIAQRQQTMRRIGEELIRRQEDYLTGKGPLKPMTMEEMAQGLNLHASTVGRAVKEKYVLCPSGCYALRSLFTAGLPASKKAASPEERGNGGIEGETVSRTAVKDMILELVAGENRKNPYSDDQLSLLLKKRGIAVSRRTVAKYRTELGIGSTFRRREP